MIDAKPFSCQSTSVLHANPYWEYHQDKYLLGDGKTEAEYYFVHSKGSTLIIPVLDDGRIIMVDQFRYLNQKRSLEFPGGGIADGLQPEENALKECEEETGFRANLLEQCGVFNPYNGVSNELCYVYIAKQIHQGIASIDIAEQCEVVMLTPEQITDCIVQGKIWDGMTLAAWTLFLHHKQTV